MKKRILIIDDDISAAHLLKLNLERAGDYEIRDEHDGARGIAAAREFKPDLVLLDLCMPGLDGGEVLSQMRTDNSVQNIPILFLTSLVSEQDGGADVITKPVSTDKLIARIEQGQEAPGLQPGESCRPASRA